MATNQERFAFYVSVIFKTSLGLFLTSDFLCSQMAEAIANTITVTINADDGAGSLRQAIASSHSGDTINFVNGLAAQTITVSSPLNLGKDLTIDGGDRRGRGAGEQRGRGEKRNTLCLFLTSP